MAYSALDKTLEDAVWKQSDEGYKEMLSHLTNKELIMLQGTYRTNVYIWVGRASRKRWLNELVALV